MKKILLIVAILAITLAMPVHAERGVGIKWYSEAEIVGEESTRCLEYGIYNPWDTDVNAILKVSDEFAAVVEKQESDAVFVKSATSSTQALASNLCFTIGDVYEEECLIGDFFCERVCPADRFEYSGQVIVEEAPRELDSGPTGSGATFGIAAPLRLIVGRSDQERDLTPLYYAGGMIAGIVTLAAVKRRHSKGKGKKGGKKRK